jgi:outer membrane murein-binding lipoprotein Lpp
VIVMAVIGGVIAAGLARAGCMTTGDGEGAPGRQSRKRSKGKARSTGKGSAKRRRAEMLLVAAAFETGGIAGCWCQATVDSCWPPLPLLRA